MTSGQTPEVNWHDSGEDYEGFVESEETVQKKSKRIPWVTCGTIGLLSLGCAGVTWALSGLSKGVFYLGLEKLGIDLRKKDAETELQKEGKEVVEDLLKDDRPDSLQEGFDEGEFKQAAGGKFEDYHLEVVSMFNEGVNADGVPLGLRAGNVLSNIIAKNVMGQEIGNAYSGRVFDEREFNFSQQLYLEAMIRVAKDNDIELEGGGLESWLVNHNKDVVLTDPDDATISISAAHLLQLIIDEYTNPDGMQMNASDQQLFRDYWRLNGDVWIEKTSSKKAPAKAAKLMPESDEVTDDEVAVNMVKEVLSAGVETVKIGKEVWIQIIEVAKQRALNDEAFDLQDVQSVVNLTSEMGGEVIEGLRSARKKSEKEIRREIEAGEGEFANPTYAELASYDLKEMDDIGGKIGFGVAAGVMVLFAGLACFYAYKWYKRNKDDMKIPVEELRKQAVLYEMDQIRLRRPEGIEPRHVIVADLSRELVKKVDADLPVEEGLSVSLAGRVVDEQGKVEKGKVMILGEKVAAEVSLPAEEVIEESDEYWRLIELVKKGVPIEFWDEYVINEELKPPKGRSAIVVAGGELLVAFDNWDKDREVIKEGGRRGFKETLRAMIQWNVSSDRLKSTVNF